LHFDSLLGVWRRINWLVYENLVKGYPENSSLGRIFTGSNLKEVYEEISRWPERTPGRKKENFGWLLLKG